MKYRFYVPRGMTLVQQINWNMVAEAYPCMGVDKAVFPNGTTYDNFCRYISMLTVDLNSDNLTRGLFGVN